MKAYKGFNKDMTCRGFQFEEGKTYEEESAELCNKGFHACLAPIDVLKYYAPATAVYHEVELDGVSDKRSDDSKVCGKIIKIGAKLDIAGLAKAQFEYVKGNCTNKKSGGYSSAVSGGDSSAVSGGDRSAVSGGYSSAVSGGDRSAVSGGDGSAVSGGDGSAVSGGYSSAVSGGYSSAVSGGDRSAVSGGDRSAVSGGDSSAAVSRGSSSVGKEGAAMARGNGVKVKGGMGAVLVAVEENECDCGIKSWCAGVVDGVDLLPDVWYRCADGKFEEVK